MKRARTSMVMTIRTPVVWPRCLSPLVPQWDDAFRDPGGTLFGPGPYLKVAAFHPEDPTDRTRQRVYCPIGSPAQPPHYLRPSRRKMFGRRFEVVALDVERAGPSWQWVVTLAECG